MQPRRPQPQSAPPGRTMMWPISPAPPRDPLNGRPSRMNDPPTPVPIHTPRTLSTPCAAPACHSPRSPTSASLPTATGTPISRCNTDPTSTGSNQLARFGTVRTLPRWTTPGNPTPTAAAGSDSEWTSSWIRPITASGPSVGMSDLVRSTTSWSGPTRPTSMLVPPTSTPATNRSFGHRPTSSPISTSAERMASRSRRARSGIEVGHHPGAMGADLLEHELEPGRRVVVVVADRDGPVDRREVVRVVRRWKGDLVVVDGSAHGGSQAHACLTCDDERGPTGLGLRARRSWRAHRNGARVVHAPGGPVAPRIPGHPRDRHHPPGDRRSRPRHRDHPPAGPSVRRGRGRSSTPTS